LPPAGAERLAGRWPDADRLRRGGLDAEGVVARPAESLASKVDRNCRKFAMKNSAPREFCTVKIFGPALFFGRAINRLSIAQVR
jgi:hypothetical protein